MKKLLQCVAFLIGFVPLFAMANPTTDLASLFGTPSLSSPSAPQDCVPGTAGFCGCWEAAFLNGCRTTPPFNRHPAWCTTAHIVGTIEKIGVRTACLEHPNPAMCEANFTSYIYNSPANTPPCPLS